MQSIVGIFNKRERWGLSGAGKLFLLLVGVVAAIGVFFGAYPFFALSTPPAAPLLVVEGWVHDYAIRAAAIEFRRGEYLKVFATGGPVQGLGGYVNDFQTSASVGAQRLRLAGVPSDAVEMVPSRVLDRDRTYSSALALRSELHRNFPGIKAVTVVTEGVHARRTRLLFEKALGPEFRVGVLGVANPDFPPHRWWRYSEGVREVLGEAIAYLYARFFFWPSHEEVPLQPVLPHAGTKRPD